MSNNSIEAALNPCGRDMWHAWGRGEICTRLWLGGPKVRHRRSWKDNTKMYLREIRMDGTKLIRLAQDRVQWRAFVNTVMNLRVP
jgi:hypothetical protein